MVNSKILVIGESCLDKFTYCRVNRLAPDLPVPVLEPVFSSETPGMAQNVVRNISSLGHTPDLVTNLDWQVHVKERFVDEKTNHTFVRVDQRRPVSSIPKAVDYKQYGLIVISDYDKGFLSEEQIFEICADHPRVILDTKKPITSFAEHAMLIKINETEMARSGELPASLRAKTIVTLGPLGAEFQGQVFPAEKAHEVYDTSGAGDAFLASLAVSILMGVSVMEAIRRANIDAGSVVGKKGVTTIER